MTVRTAVRVVPPYTALIVALPGAVTGLLVTVNVALVAPAGTVTLAGTVATAVLLLLSETGAPADGAAPERVTVAVDVAPPVTVPGLRLSAETETAGPPAGCTVRLVERVTPAPVAEMVTTVLVAGGEVVTLKAAATPKLPIWANSGTLAISGLLLVRRICTSWPWLSAIRTVPLAPCVPVVSARSKVSDVGGCCGYRTSGADTVVPFRVAEMVTVVVAVTSLVGIETGKEKLPAGAVTVAGGVAKGESLERLTVKPPVGTLPVKSRCAPAGSPPVLSQQKESRLTVVGCTVKLNDAVEAPRVAVSVTGVGSRTSPPNNRKVVNAVPAGTVTDAGWLAPEAGLLARFTTAPPAGAAAVSWMEPSISWPLKIESAPGHGFWQGGAPSQTDSTAAAVLGIVKERGVDQSVTAEVVGEALPWWERTRQNFVPDVSDNTCRFDGVICGIWSSMSVKEEFREISTS